MLNVCWTKNFNNWTKSVNLTLRTSNTKFYHDSESRTLLYTIVICFICYNLLKLCWIIKELHFFIYFSFFLLCYQCWWIKDFHNHGCAFVIVDHLALWLSCTLCMLPTYLFLQVVRSYIGDFVNLSVTPKLQCAYLCLATSPGWL